MKQPKFKFGDKVISYSAPGQDTIFNIGIIQFTNSKEYIYAKDNKSVYYIENSLNLYAEPPRTKKMYQFIFKPEDFSNIYKQIMKQGYLSRGAGSMWEPDYRIEDVAKEVNQMLNKVIESWPVAYITIERNIVTHTTADIKDSKITHKARLAFIEPIVKEPCKHEPEDLQFLATQNGMGSVADVQTKIYGTKKYCKHCGIEIKATWEPK